MIWTVLKKHIKFGEKASELKAKRGEKWKTRYSFDENSGKKEDLSKKQFKCWYYRTEDE
jgi:hypothetical protein